MTTTSKVLGVLVAVTATAALGGLSQLPWSPETASSGLLRFSWRAAGERVDRCRPPTEEDLVGVPSHMRPQEICERGMRPFHLRIAVDGQTVADSEIRASGARQDRPIYVFVEHRVEPGEHRVQVDFRPVRRDTAEPEVTARPPLRLDRRINVATGQIVVVSLTGDGRSFVVLGEDDPTGQADGRDSR